MYGGYTATNLVNMIARTLYNEGHAEGTNGRKAILSVIMNRAGNDKNKIANVIKRKGAFSCWKKMTNADWKNFIYKVPSSGDLSIVGIPKNKAIWDECVTLAKQLFDGKFTSTIGNRNAYLNVDKANKTAVDTWGKQLDLQVGNHKFGYLADQDPNRKKVEKKPEPRIYVVKKGDSLGKIAKANKMSLKDLLAKNPGIKDPDKISVG